MIKDAEIRDGRLVDIEEEFGEAPSSRRTPSPSSRTDTTAPGTSPRMTTLLMRRRSAGQDGQLVQTTVPVKANFEDIRDHFKHLGPSNPASNPKSTRVSAVKIKPAKASIATNQRQTESVTEDLEDAVDERTSLLGSQLNAKDGIQALQQSYTEPSAAYADAPPKLVTTFHDGTSDQIDRGTQTKLSAVPEGDISPTQNSSAGSIESVHDAIGRRRGHVHSGSITENIIESGGIRKVILEANSSSSGDEEQDGHGSPAAAPPSDGDDTHSVTRGDKKRNKNRRKRRNAGK